MTDPDTRYRVAIALIQSGIVPPPSARPSGDDNGSIDTRRAWARDVWALTDALIAEREKNLPKTRELVCDQCGLPPLVESDEGDRCQRQIHKPGKLVRMCRGHYVEVR